DSVPVLTATDNGFAVAWRHDPDDGGVSPMVLQYAELGTDGKFQCGPVTFPGAITNFDPYSMAALGSQRVITLFNSSADVDDVVEVLKGCKFVARRNLYTARNGSVSSSGGSRARVVAGAKGFAFAWTGAGTSKQTNTVERRILGPLVCN